MPIIDLLELWSEAFEMKQEKSALYGEPHSQPNPYYPPQHNPSSPVSEYHVDQTDPASCLQELQTPAEAEPAQDPLPTSFL